MATVFAVSVHHGNARYAAQAAQAALDEVERIGQRLSRFLPPSDISRLNRAAAGETIVVHPDTLDCLAMAERLRQATGGAFDVAYNSESQTTSPPRFQLIIGRCAVRVLNSGLQLDLGGIGKGFALDRAAAILRDWDLRCYKLSAGASTHLVGAPPPGRPGWSFVLDQPAGPERLMLVDRAISASGIGVRGLHIIDPRNGQPVKRRQRAWALAPTGAEADALSTAFLVMNEAAVQAFCRDHPRIGYRLPTPK